MKKTSLLIFMLALTTVALFAQKKEEAAVAEAVKRLNQAMIDANQIGLDDLTSKNLSYGHSSGLIEDKDTYVTSIVDGTFGFTSIELTDQTVAIAGDVAIVRHKFQAATDDKGKQPGSVKLAVMQVWKKEKGKWLLLARQATRIQ